MSQIFPKWTNALPLIIAATVVFLFTGVVSFLWYFGSPKFTDVGYRPIQPVAYSHKLHAGDLGIDCRYCHVGVEVGVVASIPPTQTCMNCHSTVKPDSDKLKLVRESWNNNQPIEWVRIHNIPDYAYFNHSIHINKGVGCITCHGNVAQMEEVTQAEPLSMGWCLDCHRNPAPNLRPANKITDMKWTAPEGHEEKMIALVKEKNIDPPTDCSGCHR